jgi:adenosine/AMP kinase
MKVKWNKKIKVGLYAILITAVLLVVLGFIFSSKITSYRILHYLHNKYGESFQIEYFDKGSILFAQMYGSDQAMVHPTNNKNLPFYVFKNTKSSGFNDNYIISNISYTYTEKYKNDIKKMTKMEVDMKFYFAFINRPEQAETLKLSVDDIESDSAYKGTIDLYIAVKIENNQDIKDNKEFLYNIYKYMKENTNRDFTVSIAYIKKDKFEDAKKLIRIAHTINFSWTQLNNDDINVIHFDSKDDIKSSSFFNKASID